MKPILIVLFSYLRDLVMIGLFITFLHFVYTVSKKHALILIVLNLTYWVTRYSITLLGRDYLNEFYSKISEDKINDEETR